MTGMMELVTEVVCRAVVQAAVALVVESQEEEGATAQAREAEERAEV
jgi:hypothetical protein